MGKIIQFPNDFKRENKKLIENFPWLLPRNRWTDKVADDYNYAYTELDLLPQGWRNLGLALSIELLPILKKANYENHFRISEWKEKYGELRTYTNGVPKQISDEIYEIISKYEEISSHVCIICGEEGYIDYSDSWFIPLCEKCKNTKE